MSKAKLSIFAVAIFFNVFFSVSANNYCKLTCDDGQRHTMCMFPKSTPSRTCTDVISTGLTNQEKESIVKLHNKLRQHVAKGLEKRGSPGPQPAAKNMPNLEWDSELEIIAQRWANQCNFDHDCCNVDRFDVGQNLAQETSSADDCEIESLVQSWYDEVEVFDAREVSSFKDSVNMRGEDVGHYTQMVWAKTTKIGCGLIKYREDGDFVTYLVCNYGEAGNVEDEPLYEKK